MNESPMLPNRCILTRRISYRRTWPFYVFEITNIVDLSFDDENHMVNAAQYNVGELGDDRLNVLDIAIIVSRRYSIDKIFQVD